MVTGGREQSRDLMEVSASPSSSSPGVSSVAIADCIEELLKFLFAASSSESLDIDLGLSKAYCSSLLSPEPGDCAEPYAADLVAVSGGFPARPLYRHLASALYSCITSGTFLKTCNLNLPIQEDESLKKKEIEWGKFIASEGAELVRMLEAAEFELHVQEPFFNQLRVGQKTIEGRCATGDYNRSIETKTKKSSDAEDIYHSGELLLKGLLTDKLVSINRIELLYHHIMCGSCLIDVVMQALGMVEEFCGAQMNVASKISTASSLLINKCLLLEVQKVGCYASFLEMLKAEDLSRILPGIETVEKGVQIYRKFYTEEKEKSNGVLAIHVLRTAVQPYISMANIIHGLGYSGIGCLLGLMHTEGTIPDALPPSRSVLMSSFMIPHHSNIKGNTLTVGARALAKHVHRSSNVWWGNFAGSDSDKNRLSLNVINHLISHCRWMNIYRIQPHNCVFEIRVDEGYGARWSRDGSKFIGFLEPYMEDGHLKGWRH